MSASDAANTLMYLAALSIRGFRRASDLTLRFDPGLNVIVGPNNIGKSAVVDALRALLSTGDEGGPRIDELDLSRDAAGGVAPRIEFDYVFKNLTKEEEADFYQALKTAPGSPDIFDAHLHVRYEQHSASSRFRPKRWCGDHDENLIPADLLEELRAVYLPPLRDPASGLRPGRGSQIARLIDRLSNTAQKEQLEALLKLYEGDVAKSDPVAKTEEAVKQRHLSMLGAKLVQALEVVLTPSQFQKFAARLSLRVDEFDVEQNGLGFNNLIYMAVVLSELTLNPDAAYRALIVEEPEAHLHPQLQAVLLEHLESIRKPAAGERPVQVFVTSHSPNFASIANLDSLACLHQANAVVKCFLPREVAFSPKKKGKLQRYLDVTRAELFFAKRILFVEGTAERFIVAALAEKNAYRLRQNSVSILSAEGLNFDCFEPLFRIDAIPIRVALLSDADPPADLYPSLGAPPELSVQAKAIEAMSHATLRPFFALKTLEYDLALHDENHPAMLEALKDISPRNGVRLSAELAAAAPAERAVTLFKGMFQREQGANVSKGEYAQALAEAIATAPVFIAPPYIKAALDFLTE